MRVVMVALILLLIMALVGSPVRRCLRCRRSLLLPHVLRRWRPRTSNDCAHCRLAATDAAAPPLPSVRPWREGRSRRGAPRRIATAGYACRRAGCRYEGITDAGIHALVADGRHGRSDHIQDFRCQACGSSAIRWSRNRRRSGGDRVASATTTDSLSVGAILTPHGERRNSAAPKGSDSPSIPEAGTNGAPT
jgi:hypothetical protein